jgi:hypothetical protein
VKIARKRRFVTDFAGSTTIFCLFKDIIGVFGWVLVFLTLIVLPRRLNLQAPQRARVFCGIFRSSS